MSDLRTVRTTCKIGACEPFCGIEVDVVDGRMTAVRGDKAHPVSKGFLCIKGRHLLEYQNDPDRLLTPMRRTPKGLVQADWQTATSEIGQRLRTISDAHGPDSIATYWGNAADTANILLAVTTAGAFGSRNAFNVLSLEFTDRGAVASRLYGDEGIMLMPDLDHTHHALLLGTNPVVTQGMALLQRRPRIAGDLRDLTRRGGTLTVVDPRATQTTALADHHLAIRPGTDLFFLLGMIHHIFETDRADQAWCDAHATGLGEWKEIAKRIEIDEMSQICDLPADEIRAEAERFSDAPSAFATTRVGVQTSPNTTLTEWAIATLNVITGNIARPGGMIFHGGSTQPAKYLIESIARGNFNPSRLGNYPHIFAGLPASVMAEDILSDDPDRIRALIVFAGNPVISFPDTEKIEAALERLELLVCLDLYISDTATFADWTLPATTQYEKSSMHFMVDKYEPTRRIEWKPQVVEPTGEARPEWQILQDICIAADVPFLNNPKIHAEVLACRERGESYPERAMYDAVMPDGVRLDDVISSPGGLELPTPPPEDFFDLQIKTLDHKIQLAPPDLVEGLRDALAAGPLQDERFPLKLISGYRKLRSYNSWTKNMPSLAGGLDVPSVMIHPDLAEQHDLQEGDAVEVTTALGTITLAAKVDAGIRPDTVAIPQFWGHTYQSGQKLANQRPGVNVNRLHTSSDRDRFTGMPIYNGRPCAIARADAQ